MTSNLIHIVEAIIFAAGVAIKRSDILAKLPEGTTRKDLNDAIKGLEQKYQDPCGIVLLCIGDKVQFASNKEYGEIVAAALKPVKERELSRALLEVMSIIAYKQPVTKLEIEKIRGVKTDHAVNKLVEYGLVEETGRLDAPGRPLLFGTTEEFLRRFSIHSLDELPVLDQEQIAHFKEEAEDEAQLKLDI